jgi:hypothetical protein
LILILVLIVCAAAAFALIRLGQKPGKIVRVTVNDSLFGEYPLNHDKEIIIEPGENPPGKNVLTIRDGQADMTQADCPDKICVNHKPISKAGETIVCLPHKVVVEVLADGKEREEESFDVIAQ